MIKNRRTYTALLYIWHSLKQGVSPLKFISINAQYLNFNQGTYSKKKVILTVKKAHRLDAHLLDTNKSIVENIRLLEQRFSYPYILKPDWGEGSLGVVKIRTREEAKKIIARSFKKKIPFFAQAFCDDTQEYDILYVTKKGKRHLLDATYVETPTVIGDGVHTTKELFHMQGRKIGSFITAPEQIPSKGEKFSVTDINGAEHGSQFTDVTIELKKQEEKLLETFSEMPFSIAKVTVKTKNQAALLASRFKVIEINILFPLMNSILSTNLPDEKKKNKMREYFQIIITLAKQSKRISIKKLFLFYMKNCAHRKKLRALT